MTPIIRLQLQVVRLYYKENKKFAVYTWNGILPSTFFISENTFMKTLTSDRNMIIFEVH